MTVRSIVLLAGVLFAAASCVHLTGQRIAWFHDVANDELRFLVLYDGIHDNGDAPDGEEQIAKFVANGDAMLLDWPFHFDREDLATASAGPSVTPAERIAFDLVAATKCEAVGWYREPNGRIGALQRITISHVSKVLAALNDAISRGILKDDGDANKEWPATLDRIRDGAQHGQQWVTLDGQQIVVTIPVHPDEWERGKAHAVDDLVKSLTSEGDSRLGETIRFLRDVARLPLSVIDDGDRVTILLGHPGKPGLARAEIRDAYQPNLEDAVRHEVSDSLVDVLVLSTTGDGHRGSALADQLAWGPPELTALALIESAQSPNAVMKERALAELARFAKAWNAAGRSPAAPDGVDREQWGKWYSDVAGH